MPYIPEKEYVRNRNRKLQTLLKQREKDRIEKMKRLQKGRKEILEEVTTHTLEEIYNEADKMYDAYITEYYKYKTRKYVRHGEIGVGTQKGSNLYLAKEFDIDYNNLSLEINRFEPNNMESYPWVTQKEVFGIVSGGHRGIPGAGDKRYLPWEYTYEGNYYDSEGKTIKEAFDDFESKLDDLYKSIRNPMFYNKYNSLRNKIYGG